MATENNLDMSYYLSLFSDDMNALQYIDESQNPISKSPLDDIIQLDGGIKKTYKMYGEP